jgi:hypothetical protein
MPTRRFIRMSRFVGNATSIGNVQFLLMKLGPPVLPQGKNRRSCSVPARRIDHMQNLDGVNAVGRPWPEPVSPNRCVKAWWPLNKYVAGRLNSVIFESRWVPYIGRLKAQRPVTCVDPHFFGGGGDRMLRRFSVRAKRQPPTYRSHVERLRASRNLKRFPIVESVLRLKCATIRGSQWTRIESKALLTKSKAA